MNLQTFDFSQHDEYLLGKDGITSMPADDKLLAEAKKRGLYKTLSPHRALHLATANFGGVIKIKAGLPYKWANNALNYLVKLRMSVKCNEEEKQAICALILSEIAETDIYAPIVKSGEKPN